MTVKSPDTVLKKPVCTWLNQNDYLTFAALADRQGVSVAAYLRSIVVDAIAEETTKLSGRSA